MAVTDLQRRWKYDARDYSVTADLGIATGGAMTAGSAVLTTSGGRAFTAADEGKSIAVSGAGASGLPLTSTIEAYTSATQVTLADDASTTVSGKTIYWGTDQTSNVQAMLSDAGSDLPARRTQPDGSLGRDTEGVGCTLPAGGILLLSGVEKLPHVGLGGMGRRSTLLYSPYNGSVIRNRYTSGTDPYEYKAGYTGHLRIRGDRTASSQDLLDLLRFSDGTLEDVEVENAGRHGVRFRECVGARAIGVRVNTCVGDNIRLEEGVVSWDDLTSSNLPSNAVDLIGCISTRADGACLRISDSNGNRVLGGFYQYGYHSSGNNVGYCVEIDGSSRNNVLSTWLEGHVEALVYQNLSSVNTTTPNRLEGCTLIAGATTNRLVIVNAGVLLIRDPSGNATACPTINGSAAPYRVSKANNGKIVYSGPPHTGTGPNGLLIEDENGNDDGLTLYAQADIQGASTRTVQALMKWHATDGQIIAEWYRIGDAHPFARVNTTTGALEFGDGTAAPDAGLYRWAAGILSTLDGDSFRVSGEWNGSRLYVSNKQLWKNATDNLLRVSGSDPTSDTSGEQIVTVGRGTTANRPSTAPARGMLLYYDTDLSQLIVSFDAVTWYPFTLGASV